MNESIAIEKNTRFSRAVNTMATPSFKMIRNAAVKLLFQNFDDEERNELYDELDRGRAVLDSYDHLDQYLFSFGKMHQAKLDYAFAKMDKCFWKLPEIEIVDYGCGMGLATICFVDYIRRNHINIKVKKITLIDPSEKALRRATLLCSKFCPNTNIIQINKEFDDLSSNDINCKCLNTLHLLSNITDLDFCVSNLASTISNGIANKNYFVIVSPWFFDDYYDDGYDQLIEDLDGDIQFIENLDSGDLDENESWTCRVAILVKNQGFKSENFTEIATHDVELSSEDRAGLDKVKFRVYTNTYGYLYSFWPNGESIYFTRDSRVKTGQVISGRKCDLVCDDNEHLYLRTK